MRRKKSSKERGADSWRLVVDSEYAELEKSKNLARVIKLRTDRVKLVGEWQAVCAEITRCSNQVWADKFAMRMLRERKNVYENLQHHFDDLESRRRGLVVRIRKIFEEIVDLGGLVRTSMDATAGEAPNVSSVLYKSDFGKNASTATQFRDQLIR